MLPLVLTTLVAAPAWATDLEVSPPPADLLLQGKGAPAEVGHIRRKKKLVIRIEGPAKLVLRFVGLRERLGKKIRSPGKATVQVDKEKRKVVRLKNKRRKKWAVAKHPRWLPTGERMLSLEIDEGSHTILIRAQSSARVGVGIIIDREPGTAAQPTPDAADATPQIGDPTESVEIEPAEPSLMTAPSSIAPVEPGFSVPGSMPSHTLAGPHGEETFFRVGIEKGMVLDAFGPGQLLLDIHAHRHDSQPESLRPIIIGVMVDDVLLQTLAVDQGASRVYRTSEPDFAPSDRVTLRVPLGTGTHQVRLTLSDSAVLGASIRPRFEALMSASEPGILTAEVARADDLVIKTTLPEVYGTVAVGALGAGFLPTNLSHFGYLAQIDTDFAIPVAGPHFSMGLSAAFCRVEEPRTFPDRRADKGSAHVNLTLTSMPIFAEARWAAPLPPPWGVQVGLGGGALLVWPAVRALRATAKDPLEVTPAGVGQVTFMLEAGPGAFVLRVGFMVAKPIDSDSLSTFDAGGGFAGLGYRFIFGDETE
ncbi:hypothetical protein ACFL6C_00230 [Myxococcota bacterium]